MRRYLDDLLAALEVRIVLHYIQSPGAEEVAALEELVKRSSGTAGNVFGTTQVIQPWKSKDHFWGFQVLGLNGF